MLTEGKQDGNQERSIGESDPREKVLMTSYCRSYDWKRKRKRKTESSEKSLGEMGGFFLKD